jgi:hypothetical protein
MDDALYLGALLAAVLLFFGPAWTRPDGMWYAPGARYSDLAISHWPNWLLVRETVRTYGQVPLWQPAILGGAPFVGNPLPALFYPPNWLALLLPLTASFSVQYALHGFGAGAALYALARWSYGRSPFAAFLGALGYAFTPKWVAHLGAGHVGLVQAYAWVPLIPWSLRACMDASVGRNTWDGSDGISQPPAERHRSWLPGLAGAAVLALIYLVDPRAAFYAVWIPALYVPYRLVGVWRRSGWRSALALSLPLSLLPLASALLAAIQILPTAELVPLTTRSALTLKEVGRDSLPWRYLLGYLIADRGGHHEWMTYVGLLPLALGVLALTHTRDAVQARDCDRVQSHAQDAWFWAGLALLALLYALGTNGPLLPLLYRVLPVLRWVRVPVRALFLVVLAVNVVATFGADALLARAQGVGAWRPGARRWSMRLAVAGLLTFVGLGIGFAALYGRETISALYALTGVGAALCAAWSLSLWPRTPRPLLQAMLLTILVVDLWPVGRSLIEYRPVEQVFDRGRAAAQHLARRAMSGGPTRIYSPSYSVPQHVGAQLGLEQLNGVDPMQLQWVSHYVNLAAGVSPEGYGVILPPLPNGNNVDVALRDATPDAVLLGTLNACIVASEFPIEAPHLALETHIEGTYIYWNARCLPRAYVVAHVRRVGGWQEAQEDLCEGFDPARGALVESGEALNGPAGWAAATVREHTPNRVVVEAEAVEPSLLVLAEVWSPGWQVTVDGVARPIYRVNGVARGVYLAPGTHTTVWTYQPASLRWGAALSACTLIVSAVAVVTAFARARSGRTSRWL